MTRPEKRPVKTVKKGALWALFLIMGLAFRPNPALAHKVVVFGWVESDRVHVEAGFGSKRPAKHAEILAYDSDHALVHQGRTDDQGRHVFDIPTGFSSDMTLEVNAGTGHKGRWTIFAKEFTTNPSVMASAGEKPASPVQEEISPLRIIAGIAIIFGMAFLVRRITSKRKAQHD